MDAGQLALLMVAWRLLAGRPLATAKRPPRQARQGPSEVSGRSQNALEPRMTRMTPISACPSVSFHSCDLCNSLLPSPFVGRAAVVQPSSLPRKQDLAALQCKQDHGKNVPPLGELRVPFDCLQRSALREAQCLWPWRQTKPIRAEEASASIVDEGLLMIWKRRRLRRRCAKQSQLRPPRAWQHAPAPNKANSARISPLRPSASGRDDSRAEPIASRRRQTKPIPTAPEWQHATAPNKANCLGARRRKPCRAIAVGRWRQTKPIRAEEASASIVDEGLLMIWKRRRLRRRCAKQSQLRPPRAWQHAPAPNKANSARISPLRPSASGRDDSRAEPIASRRRQTKPIRCGHARRRRETQHALAPNKANMAVSGSERRVGGENKANLAGGTKTG